MMNIIKTQAFRRICSKVKLCEKRHFSSVGNSEFNVRSLEGENSGIVTFTFNRPQTRNALGKNVVAMFEDAIRTIRFDRNARVLILASDVKGAFCSGADLKERATMKVHEVAPYVARLRNLLRQLELLPMPTIAALDGVALGGGLEIALACDIRVSSHDAKMGLVETRIANVPGGGGTQRLSRAIGLARAKELIFTAQVIDGRRADQIGLVQRCAEQNSDGNAAFLAALKLGREITPNGNSFSI